MYGSENVWLAKT